MKVYFTSSIRGNTHKELNFRLIHEALAKLGYEHLDDLVLNFDIQKFYQGNELTQSDLFRRTLENINKADVVVLEVSMPSLSMGYILQKSLDASKPVILLYKDGFDPFFAMGINHEKLQVIKYDDENLSHELKDALRIAQENSDVRFNFFISPAIGMYLDWVSRAKKIPRSVYLRSLIEKDMKLNSEYSRIDE